MHNAFRLVRSPWPTIFILSRSALDDRAALGLPPSVNAFVSTRMSERAIFSSSTQLCLEGLSRVLFRFSSRWVGGSAVSLLQLVRERWRAVSSSAISYAFHLSLLFFPQPKKKVSAPSFFVEAVYLAPRPFHPPQTALMSETPCRFFLF